MIPLAPPLLHVFGSAAPPVLAASDLLTNLILAAGVALVAASLLMGIRRRRAAQANRPSPRDHLDELQHKSAMRGDLEALMVEIEAMARRMGAQLDAKAVHLEKLLREADERIAQLRTTEPPNQEPSAPDSPPPPLPPPLPPRPSSPHPPSPHRPADHAPSDRDRLTRSVYTLADQGFSAPQIASELGEHHGTVELILSLRASRG